MNFDFKITTWERVNVPEHLEELVAQAIKDGKITSSNSLLDFLSENGYEVDVEYKIITEAEEQMTVEKNGGFSTVEILEDEEVIWGNGD